MRRLTSAGLTCASTLPGADDEIRKFGVWKKRNMLILFSYLFTKFHLLTSGLKTDRCNSIKCGGKSIVTCLRNTLHLCRLTSDKRSFVMCCDSYFLTSINTRRLSSHSVPAMKMNMIRQIGNHSRVL